MEDQTAYDKRYTITMEFCGYPSRRHVLRFCGEFICAYIHMQTAIDARIAHNKRSLTNEH